ncbi:hypothetical protein B0G76_7692 [Paraburkholderia sp. BL23I1N1]|nr:hypothetical protein B0G76_7692 [Paraburkholderia sp. BL23I1N1]
MRGADTFTESLFTLRKLEDFVPADHPLRAIRKMANAALAKMNGLFAGMYEAEGLCQLDEHRLCPYLNVGILIR